VQRFLVKSERILVILFLLLIPTQLGKHFWIDGSYVMGSRIDYLSPTLYLIDCVWILLFLISNLRGWKKQTIGFEVIMAVSLVLMNVMVAENKMVAVYRWIRIGQCFWMLNYFWQNKKEIKGLVVKIIPWWIGTEVLLGWMQVASGGSIGGVWYWLGERRFNFNTVGIAQMSLNGEGLVRAYGTFSHPNSLAGFLVVVLALWMRIKKKNIFWWAVFFFGVSGILICGSRTVWAVTTVLIIAKLVRWKRAVGLIMIGVGLVILAISSGMVGGWDKESWNKRVVLNEAAVEMVKENLWLGVGAGNFLVKLPKYQSSGPYWWQPVHNVPLLVVSEIGLLGVMGLGWILRKFLILNKSQMVLLGVVVVTGMVDHYWVTLPQNNWLLVVVLALMG